MTDPIVVYDAEKEIAALVDPDTHSGFGPAHIGPGADAVLEGFLLTVPYDVTGVDTPTLCEWFTQYTAGAFQPPTTPPGAGTQVEAQSSGDTGVGAARIAENEAAASGAEPPPPQPADTDVEAHEGEASTVTEPEQSVEQLPPEYVGACFACNGSGQVPTGDPAQPVTCNLCKGTGNLPAPE